MVWALGHARKLKLPDVGILLQFQSQGFIRPKFVPFSVKLSGAAALPKP
jgi:hypothetical protein